MFLAVLTHACFFRTEIGQRFEAWFADLWFSVRGTIAAPQDVVLIAMDERSYGALGVPPTQAWPRRLHAELIEKLTKLGAKRIIFDVLFVGEGADPAGDEALENAISKSRVVLGAELSHQEVAGSEMTELVTPLERFGAQAESIALVNLPEQFEHVRSFLPFLPDEARGLRSFAEAAAGFGRVDPDPFEIPTERDLINFYGPAGRGPKTFSYYQILEKEIPFPAQYIQDKVIFVGLMLRTELGPAQKDSFITPFGRQFGVEIHATAASNIIQRSWVVRASERTELMVLSLIAVVLGLITLFLGPVWGAVFSVVAIAVWGALAVFGLRSGLMIPGAILLCIINPLVYFTATIRTYIRTRRKQKRVEKAFSHYLAPTMVQELARNPDALKLGGEVVEATAVFTDLADFTSISEGLSAEQLISMLNSYFSAIAKVVFDEGGTLIKFIGDAMFVLWGAPLAMPDHARRAASAALKIQAAVDAFNAQGIYPPLVTRVGVNTGQMVVGNLGAETRFDYTAIGDSVNLASRVEGLNKYLGTSILITEDTQQIANMEQALRMGTMQVKGKEVPVILYALFSVPLAQEMAEQWRQGLRAFQSRRWDVARETFATLAQACAPLSTACAFYLDQIATLQEAGASAAWKGEIVFSSK